MRKAIAALLALAALMALTVSATAEAWIKYTTKSSVKVYEEPDTHSTVLQKLKAGRKLLIEESEGDWYAILVDDGDGQGLGWIQGKYLSDTIPQSLCSHEWGEWTVEREATCTKTGYRYRFCEICGLRDEKEIKKLGHEYGKWSITRSATCTRAGERQRTCSNCGYVQKEAIEKTAHDYGKWIVTEKATCANTGERYRKCQDCGYKQVQTLEKTAHTFGKWTVLRAATCTEVGQRVHTCQVCGTQVKQSIEKLPHEYEWKIIQQATDYSAGIRAKVCRVCGAQTASETYDPEGTLRRGDRGEAVRELQNLLVEQGYLNAGGADGMFGGGTERAVIAFQQNQGLYADGVAWPQTLKRLRHEFGPWRTIKAMTRTEPGERVRTCLDCGYEQRETLETGTVYVRGDRGEGVRAIQQTLNALGYSVGSFDGIYGRKLDTAFAAFAANHGLTAEEGKLRPGDVDAIFNAWLERLSAAEWRGQGTVSGPVNLALTVTPTGDPDDNGVVTYSWSLTNLGSQRCRFTALLLAFGSRPSFKGSDLVMTVDGVDLRANAGNSASGSFSVSQNWGEGSLNFAALAESESTGAKWLSNAVVFEGDDPAAPKTVKPIPTDINVHALADGDYPAAFNRGDLFSGASGVFMNAVHIYSLDLYDAGEMESLRAGDAIVVAGETFNVRTVARQGNTILVNGGMDRSDGNTFALDEGGDCYRVRMFDDAATYTDHGVTALTVDPSAVFIDKSDPSRTVTANYSRIVGAILASANTYFDQYNTTVTIEKGRVVEISRAYVP